MKQLLTVMVLSMGMLSNYASSAKTMIGVLQSPASGVVCDVYVCADAKGISVELTSQYLGKIRGEQLTSLGDFDYSAFTFANGIFCDTRERLCRKDRYFGPDGKRSGAVDEQYTQLLFEHNTLQRN
ncbi:hypothetical protein CRM81_05070 [Yersinia kristensenii]|nr:hypothetical protein CRM81_03895 [Yersinia kristensenii]PEH55791.1 hypothetical protein CRM81_05070 [Yersinia kristensenii]